MAASSAPGLRGMKRLRSTRMRAGQAGASASRGGLSPPSTHIPGMGPSAGGRGLAGAASAAALAAGAAAAGVPRMGAALADPNREVGVAGAAYGRGAPPRHRRSRGAGTAADAAAAHASDR